jgi:hypothetical protein
MRIGEHGDEKIKLRGLKKQRRTPPERHLPIGRDEICQRGQLLEFSAVPKLADEPGHRIGMNPQEPGCTALVPL